MKRPSGLDTWTSRHVTPWLISYRIWGLPPLILVGLIFHAHSLPVRAGILMMLAGGIGIFAGTLLRIICRTFTPPGESMEPLGTSIVTDGPFAITRNPVFLSEVAIALGIAMMSRMPWLVLLTVVVSVIVYAPIIEWQEAVFRASDHEHFRAYSRTVPRWFSLRNLFDTESYLKSRSRVPLLRAVRGESLTMLIALTAILAFLAKANLEAYY